jgi:hypothetical protein
LIRSTAVPSAEIHPILTLKTAHRHDEAGVRDIQPVRRDFVLGGRTSVRPWVDRAENRKRRQQTYLESSFGHRLAIDEIVAFRIGQKRRALGNDRIAATRSFNLVIIEFLHIVDPVRMCGASDRETHIRVLIFLKTRIF